MFQEHCIARHLHVAEVLLCTGALIICESDVARAYSLRVYHFDVVRVYTVPSFAPYSSLRISLLVDIAGIDYRNVFIHLTSAL